MTGLNTHSSSICLDIHKEILELTLKFLCPFAIGYIILSLELFVALIYWPLQNHILTYSCV